MTADPSIHDQIYQYFRIEAVELLQSIEQDLLSLLQQRSIETVHNLMRNAHTLKGAAASVGRETIKTVAHHLEDVFKSLYDPELIIDGELGALLLEGYECLRLPLMAEVSASPIDETMVLDQTASVFAQLQAKLGDFFGREAELPSSSDLGFDVVESIFLDSVQQDLNQLAVTLSGADPIQVADSFRGQSEFFLGLAESYALPGLGEVAQATLLALDLHPDQALTIATIALAEFQDAREAVLAGDRSRGGEPSVLLLELAGLGPAPAVANTPEPVAAVTVVETAPSPTLQDPPPPQVLSVGEVSVPQLPSELLSFLNSSASTDLFAATAAAPTSLPPQPAITQPVSDRGQSDLLETALANLSDLETELHGQVAAPSPAFADHLLAIPTPQPGASLESLLAAADSPDSLESLLPAATAQPPSLESLLTAPPAAVPQTSGTNAAVTKTSVTKTSVTNAEEAHPTKAVVVDPIPLQSGASPADQILQNLWSGEGSSITTSAPPPTVPAKPKREGAADPASATAPAQVRSIRVDLKQLEHLNHTVSELTISQSQQSLQTDHLHTSAQTTLRQFYACQQALDRVKDWSDQHLLFAKDLPLPPLGLSQAAASYPRNSAKHTAASNTSTLGFDALEMHAYSELHILLQSVYERMAMLLENIESFDGGILQSQLNLKRQKRLLINAQDELLQARMVPIGTVLQRFPPLLQQLVTSHHKPATLSLSGTQVLIDKAVAEKLYDPLLHLIRNAFDHGIESAELRRQAGKPETGQISVRAYHQGNRTTIEIQDDGQGLHWDRIRKRAVERQLLSLEQAQQASASQLTDLLFEPGFSTASQITQLSGRGIGLDVVRSQIQALQGSISINSVAGAGTTFLLQFPLTLTTERLLICQSKGINYALLTQSVEQILFPKADRIEVKPGQDSQQFLRWGESAQQLVPIRSLAQLMDYRYPLIGHTHQSQLSAFPLERKSSGQTDPLLLIRQRDQLLCLAVDRIMVEQELVIKSLGTRPTVPAYIQGYSVLGDGGLALVIDPLILVGQTWSTGHARLATVPIRSLAATGGDLVLLPAAQPQASAPESPGSAYVKPQQTILIVDDSITQRQAISLTLQNAGYTVLQAGDGEEALAKLQQSDQIRLVICDIEMPKMNGFEFLEAYRQHADLTSIPVVMLTSRSGQKHRQTALNLGARGYLTKPCAEQELLKTLAGFLNASLAPVG